ncbi:hypothetical protein [Pigmentiphaga kullae]|uniref:LysR substrate binding domain-containing protein n=1 Tax=Pigmentiphaga kullae TaxID=151784 RepID=A0A4Q7NNR3_9BURK|nr:hypothetical protein [Pigmentiphaga kullae]RZS86586.1 hypothetical protein EV675_2633 [Pigmentiphaga kullae]
MTSSPTTVTRIQFHCWDTISSHASNFLSNLSLVEQGGLITASPTSAAHRYKQLRSISILPIQLGTPLPPISLIVSRSRAIEGPLQALRIELTREARQLRQTLGTA